MTNQRLFNIWEPFRQNLIDRHQFYIEVARERLLSQFPNIEEEAEKYANEKFKEAKQQADPEKFDVAQATEWATDEGGDHYIILDDIAKMTQLSVIAGMYHEWDKQLRDWMTREILNWHTGPEVRRVVWNVNFKNIINFLEACGWSIRTKDYYQSLDKCHFVVNVYKHGDGDSFEKIRKTYPEFIESTLNDEHRHLELKYSDYTTLVINEEHINEFSNAIIAFWKDVPTNIFAEDSIIFPDWFKDAHKKDCKEANS